MKQSNAENNVYSSDDPVFKQKVYEIKLVLDQCKYDKKDKIIKDATTIIQNYKDLIPVITAMNVNLFEVQGNIPVAFNGSMFAIYIHVRFQTNYPDAQPFLFLKNIDTAKFDANPLYKTGEVQNGQFIFFNNFLPSAKKWSKNYKIIEFMSEIQSALSRNFPFFLKSNPLSFNQSQFQYNPQAVQVQPNFQIPQNQQQQLQYNQSQYRRSEPIQNPNLWLQQQQSTYNNAQLPQQSQYLGPPQQQIVVPQQNSLYNPYQPLQSNGQSQVVQQQLQQQPQQQNLKPQQQKQDAKEEITTIPKKLLLFGSSVFALGKEIFQSQEAKEQKIIEETKIKVDLELINSAKKLQESTAKQKSLTEELIKLHCQQLSVSRELSEKDEQIKASIHILDQQLAKLEQDIEICVTIFSQQNDNNIEELIQTDPFSNQIIELESDILASQEGLFFIQKKFRYQQLDYDSLVKATRQLSSQMFDSHLLLKKCTGKL